MAATTMTSVIDGSTHQNPRGYVSYQDVTFTATGTRQALVHNFGQHLYGAKIAREVLIKVLPIAEFTQMPFVPVATITANGFSIVNPNASTGTLVRVYAQALHSIIE